MLVLRTRGLFTASARAVKIEVRRRLGAGDALRNHLHMPESLGETLCDLEHLSDMRPSSTSTNATRATGPASGLLAIGLYWAGGEPVLAVVDPAGREHRRPVGPGSSLSLSLCGPRRCIGIWDADVHRRRACPRRALLAEAGPAQCPACAADDPGRALARDALPDDGRAYALYLAWFGTARAKIGLTAVERGVGRLAEQGAIVFTWLARGPLGPIREAERAAATSGAVTERVGQRAKTVAWWRLPDAPERERRLRLVHRDLTRRVRWPDALQAAPFEAHDLTRLYGLDASVPRPVHEVASVHDGAVLSGTLVCLVGREAVIEIAGEPALMDLRLLEGWTLADAGARAPRLDLRPFGGVATARAEGQETLF